MNPRTTLDALSSGRPPLAGRVGRRSPELYAGTTGAALAFAVLGRLAGWNFAETPLVILTLPLSIVPLVFKPLPAVLIASCAGLAAVMWHCLRSLREQYAEPTAPPHGGIRAAPEWLKALAAGTLALWAIASAASAALFVESHWLGTWPKLRSAVGDFSVPPGMRRAARFEAGSEACFISCYGPRVSVVLTSSLPPDETCRSIEPSFRATARDVGALPGFASVPLNAACSFEGRLPDIYFNARLTGVVLTADELEQHPDLTADAGGLPLAGQQTVVALLFHSGLT